MYETRQKCEKLEEKGMKLTKERYETTRIKGLKLE